jgi:cyclopropane-fatty-acyl-phospholipid synthase
MSDVRADRSGQSRAVERVARLLQATGAPCELQLPDGELLRFGASAPVVRVVFTSDRALRGPLTQLRFGRAYVEGDIDIEGDFSALLDIRDRMGGSLALRQKLRFASELFLRSPTWVNARSIKQHYSYGDDFYLAFIERRYRFYSHCLFHSADETLEEAAEHKLESMWNALGLEPGMRLLDIGGGWGGVTEYCGARGVHVTSLTLAEDSARYIRALIRDRHLPGEVVLQDMLDYRPRAPFDHAVIYGVIEHIPNYRRFCVRAWDALKPGGRLYLDAAASTYKYAMSLFSRRYIWTGTTAFLALPDIVEELLFHGFNILEVQHETRDYELTMNHWAQRLEAAHDEIAARWGEELYRAFRVYLRGGAHAFKTGRLQAYHLVAERRADPGPRPGAPRRLVQFTASLR